MEGVDPGFLGDFRALLFLETGDAFEFAPLGLRFGKGTSSLSAVPAIGIPNGAGIDGGAAPRPTVTLSASPSSIDRGQSTTLTWSSTSAESAEITPDIGDVPTSGTRKVSPNVTTTNATVPGEIVQPGLELVVEIDPDTTLGSAAGLTKRIPETGRLSVEVRAMPTLDLTLIPFLWCPAQDKSILGLVDAMAADPEGHELLWGMRTLLPIGNLEVTAHEPVLSSSNSAFTLVAETEAIRALEGASGYYMGTMPGPAPDFSGVAHYLGKSSFAVPDATTMAHELGHNLSLGHAPCRITTNLDPSFPEIRGSIGAWGYDFRLRGHLVPPQRPDLMANCYPRWIGDYHFTNALRYRLYTASGDGPSSLVAAAARSLLLWGGVDAGGAPFLEPAFAVSVPASLPRSTGDHRIVGRTAGGEALFSLRFPMPELADGDGRSTFAFVLPVPSEWAERLSTITLTGPGGSFTLDRDTHRPVTILRNPRTGQIRAILRGSAAAPENLGATVSALSLNPGMERLTSRGIPGPDDWTR